MSQTVSSLIVLVLVVSLQISLSECRPTSTTQDKLGQGSVPCEPSNSPECTSVSPSPAEPVQLCKSHQREFDSISPANYFKKCNLMRAGEKKSNGTLEQSDINNCYRPQCDHISGSYLAKQCSFHFRDWCWCSSPDGYAIPGTFQRNMPYGYCTDQPKCNVDGILYDSGAIFTPASVCGLCECHSNRTHTCFVEYLVDANGRLSSDQVDILKRDSIQAFKLQYSNDDHASVDIKQIYKMNSETNISESQKEMFLSWKFIFYDKNEDNVLSRTEVYGFHEQLAKFFGCNKFFDYLNELMDNNNDNEISLQEWNAFFEVAITSDTELSGETPTQFLAQKRAAPLDTRKPLHLRKKFQYVIS